MRFVPVTTRNNRYKIFLYSFFDGAMALPAPVSLSAFYLRTTAYIRTRSLTPSFLQDERNLHIGYV